MKLNTIIVDDEPRAMSMFMRECENDGRINIVGCFERAQAALDFARANRVDFALLDIEMPGMKGTDLAAQLRILYPEIIIIFVTAYSSYFLETLKLRSDYFVLKPYNLSDVKDVLQRAALFSARLKKRVYIRTFGSFDMFVDSQPVVFYSRKSKEALALLIDRRGGVVTTGEMLAYMWEDAPDDDVYRSYVRKALQSLRRMLDDRGLSGMLTGTQSSKSLDVSMFDCDLNAYMEGKGSFGGEYMSQYSWAEGTLAMLERMEEKRRKE